MFFSWLSYFFLSFIPAVLYLRVFLVVFWRSALVLSSPLEFLRSVVRRLFLDEGLDVKTNMWRVEMLSRQKSFNIQTSNSSTPLLTRFWRDFSLYFRGAVGQTKSPACVDSGLIIEWRVKVSGWKHERTVVFYHGVEHLQLWLKETSQYSIVTPPVKMRRVFP